MLAGRDCAAEGEADVDAALRIVGGLALMVFDERALTVCPWHTKFERHMLPAGLANGRPAALWVQALDVSSTMSIPFSEGGVQRADVQIYEAASRRFWAEIDKFGVTRSTAGSKQTWS